MILEKFEGLVDFEECKDCNTICCHRDYLQTMSFWPTLKTNGVFPEETIDLAINYFES
jgi:hypothetical protein